MPVNRLPTLLIYVWIVLPALLFALAWRKYFQPEPRILLVPTLSAVLLPLAVVHDLKWSLLGPDYSNRLYVTIGLNMLLAVVATVYFGVRKRWIAALAALILALDWLYMGAVNSVV